MKKQEKSIKIHVNLLLKYCTALKSRKVYLITVTLLSKDTLFHTISQFDVCVCIIHSSCCPQKPLLYLTMAACMAGLGGVLFGYDIGM